MRRRWGIRRTDSVIQSVFCDGKEMQEKLIRFCFVTSIERVGDLGITLTQHHEQAENLLFHHLYWIEVYGYEHDYRKWQIH